MPKLIIDDTPEKFTRSKCTCKFCVETHQIVDNDFDKFTPKTNLQNRMMKVIKKLERKYK